MAIERIAKVYKLNQISTRTKGTQKIRLEDDTVNCVIVMKVNN